MKNEQLILEKRLRVLMLATDAHGGFGGIAQYNRDIIDAMCGFPGIDEVVVLTRVTPEVVFNLPAKSTYDVASAAGITNFLARSTARAWERFDLVYCAHINLLPIAALIAKFRRLPLVLAIYGIDAWHRPAGTLRRFGLKDVSLVSSISQITLDRFLAWSGFSAAKCAVLPNAIHLADFGIGPKENPLARRLGVERRPVILTFGRMFSMERYKGFDEVIDAMPRLITHVPELVYVAAGDGGDRARLEDKVRTLGLTDHVVFTGRVSEEEKADLYHLSDVYVMPSSGEGFGFVILEALACGIPVVASCVDGTREAVRGGKLGDLVDPKNPVALEAAILGALSRSKTIQPGLDFFSFSNFGKRLEDALSRVLPMQS